MTPSAAPSAVGAPKSRSEAHAQLLEVEARRGLLDYGVDGWSVWPIIRKAVGDRLASNPRSSQKTSRVRPLWGLALRDVAAFLRLPARKLLVKTYTSGLLDRTAEGKLRDIWFDDLILAHPSAQKIEGINNRALIPLRAEALVPVAETTTLLDLTAQILARTIKVDQHVTTLAREMSSLISDEFGLTVPDSVIRSLFATFSWQRRLYTRLLEKARPSTIITVDFGEYGLVAAAKELGIRVLELQHGIADRHHAAYAWGASASESRTRMPIADRMLLFGEYWSQELSQFDFWRDRLDVVGSSRCDRHRAIPRTSGTGPFRLLVTADGIEHNGTIGLLREFLDHSHNLDFELIIKLHPIYTTSDQPIREAFAGDRRVTIRSASEGESTFRLLRVVDLHASISSASHYDALGLGTPTAILGTASYRTVVHLHEQGHASLVFSGQALVDALRSARNSPVPPEVSEFYFRPGAVDNIMAVL